MVPEIAERWRFGSVGWLLEATQHSPFHLPTGPRPPLSALEWQPTGVRALDGWDRRDMARNQISLPQTRKSAAVRK